jgi:hypothetical protein
MSKRVLPKPVTGKKMRFGIVPHGTKSLLDSALKVWELRNGFTPLTSTWQKRPGHEVSS